MENHLKSLYYPGKLILILNSIILLSFGGHSNTLLYNGWHLVIQVGYCWSPWFSSPYHWGEFWKYPSILLYDSYKSRSLEHPQYWYMMEHLNSSSKRVFASITKNQAWKLTAEAEGAWKWGGVLALGEPHLTSTQSWSPSSLLPVTECCVFSSRAYYQVLGGHQEEWQEPVSLRRALKLPELTTPKEVSYCWSLVST